jgi:hypothetical protein
MTKLLALPAIAILSTACSNDTLPPLASTSDAGVGGTGSDAGDTGIFRGIEICVEVPEQGRAFVDLDAARAVAPPGDGRGSTEWDLAFSGWDVFTNSGPSGDGNGGAFGPLDDLVFLSDSAPSVPFLDPDETAGAFRDWYDYEGGTHILWSRYHVYGVRSGTQLFKLQVLGYYGEISGTPVSAVYRVRYAAVDAAGSGPTTVVDALDATAGGTSADPTKPSACLKLATGEKPSLPPDAARVSTDWDLCLRRDNIAVNGEQGGPGSAAAVDLDAAKIETEALETVKARTADSELARFDATGHAELTASEHVYRGDHVASAFADRWADRDANPPVPFTGSWLVLSGAGSTKNLVIFDRLERPTSASAGQIVLRVRSVK